MKDHGQKNLSQYVEDRPELRQIQARIEAPLVEQWEKMLEVMGMTKADWFRAVIRREIQEQEKKS